MPRIFIDQAPVKVKFGDTSQFKIVSIKTVDKVNIFTYRIPLVVDANVAFDSRSQIRISVLRSQKKPTPLAFTNFDLKTGAIYQKIRSSKKLQEFDILATRKIGAVSYISSNDIAKSVSFVDIDITERDTGSRFNLMIDCIDSTGYVTNFDKRQVDHQTSLNLYEVPSTNYVVRVGFYDKNTASICATTRDQNIGSFNFFVRNLAPLTLIDTTFEYLGKANVDQYGNAQLDYQVTHSEKFAIAATPISRLSGIELSNSSVFESGVNRQDVMLGFYVSDILDDVISFSVINLTAKIKRLILYRQVLGMNEKILIDSLHVDIASQNSSLTLTDDDRLVHYDSVYTISYVDDQSVMRTSPTQVFVPALKLNTLASITAASGSIAGTSISFNVDIAYNTSTSYDLVVNDLKTLGLDNLLDDDLKKMTNNLKPITRVLASRIDATSGLEEDMGVHATGSISLPYSDDMIYRFEAAVRSSPEILENIASSQNLLASLARDSKDPIDTSAKVLGTNAKFNQTSFTAKFFSKNSLQSSLLKYGRASSGYDLGYYAGRTGVFTDVVIKPARNNINIVTTTKRLEDGGALVTWTWDQKNAGVVSFNVQIGNEVHYALVRPDVTTALFQVNKNKAKNITIVPIVDGREQIENSKVVEI